MNIISMRGSKHVKAILKSITFVLIFVTAVSLFTYIFTDKAAQKEIYGFRYVEDNTLDILLLGPSTMATGGSSMTLWGNYGLASYNIAMGGQTIPQNYYNLKMALESQSPKLLVLDVGYLFVQYKMKPARMHQLIEHTAPSFVKIEAVTDLVDLPSKWSEYFLRLSFYHARWDSLNEEDFLIPMETGWNDSITLLGDGIDDKLVVLPPDDFITLENYELALKYLDKILVLCKENGVDILFTNFPSYAQGEVNHGDGFTLQRMWNGFAFWAEEKGYNYINYLHILDEIEFDFSTDIYDWRHMNYYGQQKTTLYLGDYISANYDIPDRRMEQGYAVWDEYYGDYEKTVKKQKEKALDNA